MQLYSRIIGSGPPVLVLHGLFGMSDNWVSIGNALAAKGFTVHLIDLRNHGRSPHAETHRYPDMCDDLLIYLEQKGLDSVDIIGHSMGGKLAMIFGLLEPEKVHKLIIVDIAPSDYRDPKNIFHTTIIELLQQLDLNAHSGRGTIREELTQRLGDPELAMFLAKNIDRDVHSKKFRWKCNLPVLQKFLQHIHIGLEELELYAPCPVKTLFIKGNDSAYVLPEHEPDRLNFFQDSEVVGIDDAGHWVHSSQPEKFLEAVSRFLLPEK